MYDIQVPQWEDEFWKGQSVYYDAYGDDENPSDIKWCAEVEILESYGDGYYEIEFTRTFGQWERGDVIVVHENKLSTGNDDGDDDDDDNDDDNDDDDANNR